MRLFNLLAIVAVIIILGIQLFNLYKENRTLVTDLNELRSKDNSLIEENRKLRSDIEYFSNSDNIAKELKSRFDYKRPGEKLIKIQ